MLSVKDHVAKEEQIFFWNLSKNTRTLKLNNRSLNKPIIYLLLNQLANTSVQSEKKTQTTKTCQKSGRPAGKAPC